MSIVDCKSIVFNISSSTGQAELLEPRKLYDTIVWDFLLPKDDSHDERHHKSVIPVKGFFHRNNNLLVAHLTNIVDQCFVPQIMGKSQSDHRWIAQACRGFGFCKLLIMAQNADFGSDPILRSDYIWLVISLIDESLQKSLAKVRSGLHSMMDKETKACLIIWFYTIRKLKIYMTPPKGQNLLPTVFVR